MPASIALGSEIFSDYVKVATLTKDKRREVFGKFSNGQKANFIKVNLALQFIKRPTYDKRATRICFGRNLESFC